MCLIWGLRNTLELFSKFLSYSSLQSPLIWLNACKNICLAVNVGKFNKLPFSAFHPIEMALLEMADGE